MFLIHYAAFPTLDLLRNSFTFFLFSNRPDDPFFTRLLPLPACAYCIPPLLCVTNGISFKQYRLLVLSGPRPTPKVYPKFTRHISLGP